MKKVIILLTIVISVALLVGCNKKTEKTSKETEEKTNETSKSLTGILDEVKDFMFTVVDENQEAYTFNYDKDNKPEGFDKVKSGDKVKVVYTGELSALDPFEGSVLSIVKAE